MVLLLRKDRNKRNLFFPTITRENSDHFRQLQHKKWIYFPKKMVLHISQSFGH